MIWVLFLKVAWLDLAGGGYLPKSSLTGYPSLSINYVHMSKDVGKRLPQLYYLGI